MVKKAARAKSNHAGKARSSGGKTRPSPRRRAAASDQLAAVRCRLQEYADRGVFRGYTEQPPRAGRHYFRFTWLGRDPFALTYDPGLGTLTFTNVLPHVPARSALFADLKRFIEGRSSTKLPAHRRIDLRRARAGCASRRGTMLIQVTAKPQHHAYAVTKVINLVHEVFLHLHTYFPEYLWEHYDVAQE